MPEFPEVTVEGLRALPRWARVAFAARCGRRVQPLLRRYWVHPHLDALRAFDNAIALAEQSAAMASPAVGLEDSVREAESYAPAMAGLPKLVPYGSPGVPVQQIDFVRMSVANTAVSAAASALATGQNDDQGSTLTAFDAYGWAVHAADCIKVRGTDKAMRFDLSYLRKVSEASGFSNSTPIPPDIFAWEKELSTYRRELPNLLPNEGKFVAIKGNEVLGPWETYEDALQAGYDRYGLNPVLVKKIEMVAD